MSVLITAADAVAVLRAAGHTVTRTTGPDAARRYGCQTLRYVVDGRAVNLGRLRQMATAEPAPVATPVAAPVATAEPAPPEPVAQARPRLNATSEPAPVNLAALAADLGQSLGLSGAGRHLTAAGCRRRPVLPGEPTPPPPPPAPLAEPLTLPELRAAAAAGRPVSLARLARLVAVGLSEPAPTPDSLRARAVTRSAEGDRLAAAGDPDRAAVAARHADALTAWADQLSPAPTGDAWAGQPWDPGTPEARARVALQGERVAILWPIAQALTGAGVTLPGSWVSDGPIMAGEWPTDRALAALPIGAIATAAAALAALPPVTRAQARALELCRGQGVAL
jgi:hypothetical protein